MLSLTSIVNRIGARAAQILEEGGSALVHGSTSRGIFLLVNSRWILFLTPESYHGPLTLNLDRDTKALKDIKAGTPVEIQEGRLWFKDSPLHLEFWQSIRWETPKRFDAPLSREERQNQQARILDRLLIQANRKTIGRPVLRILDPLSPRRRTGERLFSRAAVEQLQGAWGSRETEKTVQAMSWFLGRGPGLTPSGDDLVTGLLLALHRWGDEIGPAPDLAELSQRFLPLVYRKTSTLSANLIECAFSGEGDERILRALDGLMTGKPDATTCADLLLDYGSSSGKDAFLGMLLATGS